MKIPLAVIFTLLGGAAAANAQLIAVENFNIGPAGVGYTADRAMTLKTTDVFGNPPQNPPPAETGIQGYYGAYNNADQDMPILQRLGEGNTHLMSEIKAGALNYFNGAHLKTQGGKLYMRRGGNDIIILMNTDPAGPFADYTNGNLIGEKGGTLWMSYLFQLEGLRGSVVQNYVQLVDGINLNRVQTTVDNQVVWVRNWVNRMQFGQGWNSLSFSLNPPSANHSDININVNLVVLRIDYNPSGNDTMTLYFNPPVADQPPATPSGTYSAHSRKFNMILSKTQSPDNLGMYLDAIRFGKTWADVVPQAALLTLNATAEANGSVAASPTPTNGTYVEGTVVTLTATASSGYRFAGWTGDVPSANASSNPVQITMDANKTVQATFEAIPTYTLTTVVEPAGAGTIVRDVENPVRENEEVIFTATAGEGYVFQRWEYGDNVSSAAVLLIEATMDMTITAVFASTDLNVEPAAASYSAAGGSGSFTVNSALAYTVSSSAAWLSATASGDTVNYTVAANPGQGVRSGTVTVSNSGGGSATYAVSQFGSAIFGEPYTVSYEGGFHFNFLFEFFYAEFYPYIYSFKPDLGWLYIFPAESEELGYFYYDFTAGGFFFSSGPIYPDTMEF